MAAAKKLKIGVVVNRSKPGAMEVLNQLIGVRGCASEPATAFREADGSTDQETGF